MTQTKDQPQNQTPKQVQKKIVEWSIVNFYKDAWALIKSNKKLLILGVAAVVFSSGSGNSFNRAGDNISDSIDEQVKEEEFDFESLEQDLDLDYDYEDEYYNLEEDEDFAEDFLMDEEVEESIDPWEDMLKPALKAVPVPIYFLIGVEIAVSIIFMFIFGIVVQAWARGALVGGIGEADKSKDWQLSTVARNTWRRVKSIVWLQFVPWIIFVFALFVVIIMIVILTAIVSAAETLANSPLMSIASVLLAIAFVTAIFVYAIKIILAQIMGLRFIMLENLGGNDAFKKAYTMGKGNVFKMLRLGVVNTIVGAIVSMIIAVPFVLIMIIVAFALVPQFEDGLPSAGTIISAVLSGGVLLLIMIVLMSIFSVVFTTFKAATWHYAYKYLRVNPKNK